MAQARKPTGKNEAPDQPKGWTRRVMSRDEITVRTGMQAYENERQGFVLGLKADVWNGSYDPDIDEVAESMLAQREAEAAIARTEESGEAGSHRSTND